MTTLAQLAATLPKATLVGDASLTALEYDSRAVVPGALFVALVGGRFDVRNFHF